MVRSRFTLPRPPDPTGGLDQETERTFFRMAQSNLAVKEDFASLLEESFNTSPNIEGSVIKGTIVRVDDDFVLIDVGLKSEGRIPLKEFARGGREPEMKSGDRVDVYVERYEDR